MDYEKAYKEALERAKNLHEDAIDMGENIRAKQCEIIFPELAESEDERIRKALLEYFGEECDTATINGIYCYKIYAWLEKQGEQSKKVSIWKHWKDGIAGGEEGKQIFLIKSGLRYSISSCLGQECDYIKLSELDELLREEKPKWTEEDEYHWTICLECVEECATQINTDFSKTIQWLQSLKQKIVQ